MAWCGAQGLATAAGQVKGVVLSAANLIPKPNVRGVATAVLTWLKGVAAKGLLPGGLLQGGPLGAGGALGGVVRSVLTAWLSPVKLREWGVAVAPRWAGASSSLALCPSPYVRPVVLAPACARC